MFPGNWVQLQLGKGCSFQKQAPEHMVSALQPGRVSQLRCPLHATMGTQFQLPALRTLFQEGTSVHPHPAAAPATVPRRSQQWGDRPSLGAPASCRGGKWPQRPALPGASPVPRFLPCVLFINHSVLFFFHERKARTGPAVGYSWSLCC